MKKTLLFFLLLWSFTISAGVPVGELMRQADRLYDAGSLKECSEIYSRVYNDTAVNVLVRLRAANSLGEAMLDLGCFQKSFDVFEKAIEIGKASKKGFSATDRLRLNTADLYSQFGKYENARNLLEGIRPDAPQDIQIRKAALSGTIYGRMKEYEKALEALDEAVEAMTADSGNSVNNDSANYGVLLQNRGYICMDAGRYDEASRNLEDAISYLKGDNRYVALSNLALVESKCGNHEKALEDIEAVVSYFKGIGKNGERREGGKSSTRDYLIALRKKGEILANAGDIGASRQVFQEYFKLEKDNIFQTLPSMNVNTRLNYWTSVKPGLSKVFLTGGEGGDFIADVALFRHQTSLMGMNDTSRLRENLSLDAAKLKNILPSKGVAVQFIEYETGDKGRSYAAVVTPKKGETLFVPLFSEEFIKETGRVRGESILNAISKENPTLIDALYSSTALGDSVWQPILSLLPDNVEDIYFTPEGVFHLWGIENMPSKALEGKRLHRMSSMANVKDKNKAKGLLSGKSMIVGGLDYSLRQDKGSGESEASKKEEESVGKRGDFTAFVLLKERFPKVREIFRYLPATRTEADTITALLGEKATLFHELKEDNCKEILPGYNHVHIASHGYCLVSGLEGTPVSLSDSVMIDRSLLYSGIALTGANNMEGSEAMDDGILSAREICDLDMKDVNLVVLSACQTAKGEITDEGVSGLVRALKMAGAGTIVASLWEVDDNSTRLFMEGFYEGLQNGLTTADAYTFARSRLKEYTRTVEKRRFSPAKMKREKGEGEVREVRPYTTPFYTSPFILID
ncbi:MAG: CHAT domain-containing protein [Muribaculaceae bacterium]|nr:CHAT domain-containing protein [Muribaculaceae bacterium]